MIKSRLIKIKSIENYEMTMAMTMKKKKTITTVIMKIIIIIIMMTIRTKIGNRIKI